MYVVRYFIVKRKVQRLRVFIALQRLIEKTNYLRRVFYITRINEKLFLRVYLGTVVRRIFNGFCIEFYGLELCRFLYIKIYGLPYLDGIITQVLRIVNYIVVQLPQQFVDSIGIHIHLLQYNCRADESAVPVGIHLPGM